MSFYYIMVASSIHEAETIAALTAPHEQALTALGGRRLKPNEPPPSGPLFYFVQTGGVERDILRRYHSRVQQGHGGPILLLAHPSHNSLAASLEILAQVRQEGGRGRIYLLHGQDDQDVLSAILRTARCMTANVEFAGERIGRIGASSPWLVASSQHSEVVANRFGCKVLDLSLDELHAHIEHEAEPVDGHEFTVWQHAVGQTISETEFRKAVKLFRALNSMAKAHRLTGLTLRCFDLLHQEHTTGCLAMALLGDAGLCGGCEGDIPSILLLCWLRHLTGRTAWMANPSTADARTGELRLAHCTVPFGLLNEYSLDTHFESGIGVAIAGQFPPGEVTLLRLGGADLEQWWGAEGALVASESHTDECRTQARIHLQPEAVQDLLERPLGNHLIMVPGHIKDLFAEAFEWQSVMLSKTDVQP